MGKKTLNKLTYDCVTCIYKDFKECNNTKKCVDMSLYHSIPEKHSAFYNPNK